MQLFIYIAVMMVAAIIGGLWYVRGLDGYELYDDAVMLRANGHRVGAWIMRRLVRVALTVDDVERFAARTMRKQCGICNDPASVTRTVIADEAPWHLCTACADEIDYADWLEGLA